MMMTVADLYDHIRYVGFAAMAGAGIVAAIALALPLLLHQGNAGVIPLPRERPALAPTGKRGDRLVPGLERAPIEQAWRLVPGLPSTTAPVPELNLTPITEHLTREAVRDIKNKRETRSARNEQATCLRHGLRTQWEGRHRWRCRKS